MKTKFKDFYFKARHLVAQLKIARFAYRALAMLFIRVKQALSNGTATLYSSHRILFAFKSIRGKALSVAVERFIDADYISQRYQGGPEAASDILRIVSDPNSFHDFDPNPNFDTDWFRVEYMNPRLCSKFPNPIHYYLSRGGELRFRSSPILTKQRNGVKLLASHYSRSESKKIRSDKIAVLIPVFNNWIWTNRCLESLRINSAINMQNVFVVDDASSDQTQVEIKKWYPDVKLISNDQNLGFLESVNRAYEYLKEDFRYVWLLNNDTEIQPGTLERLLEVFEINSDAMVVGSKLIFGDGEIQEIGGVIFSDGSPWHYGRHSLRSSPLYAVTREADYVSGASALIDGDKLPGTRLFDEIYKPAYFEDTDLSMTARNLGYKTFVAPCSVVVHHEGKSHGTNPDSGIKTFQISNQAKFANKWSSDLTKHFSRTVNIHRAAFRLQMSDCPVTMLWFDNEIPQVDRDSGSVRAVELMKIVKNLGIQIIFCAIHNPKNAFSAQLSALGIIQVSSTAQAKEVLENLNTSPKFVWISRHNVASSVFKEIKENFPDAETIFDTVDLHHVRLLRAAELTNSKTLKAAASVAKTAELGFLKKFDRTIVVSDFEKNLLLAECSTANVSIVSNVHIAIPDEDGQNPVRKGLVFIGNFNHHPNSEGMLWFLEKVWPLLDERIKRDGIDICGQNPPDEITGFSSSQIRVHGWVADSRHFVRKARMSIAPLLSGAGVKGKIGESAMAFTPIVTTSIGAEGMGLENNVSALIADNPEDFADFINQYYLQDARLVEMATTLNQIVKSKFGSEVARSTLIEIFGQVENQKTS